MHSILAHGCYQANWPSSGRNSTNKATLWAAGCTSSSPMLAARGEVMLFIVYKVYSEQAYNMRTS